MPRQVKRIKPLIYVFYEGESEQQYIDYLKIRCPFGIQKHPIS